jgi:hypothetical protein
MNADELEIYEFLKAFPDRYVSVVDVCRRAGNRNRYAQDKGWANPILRRMEMDGMVESNELGEYRAKIGESATFRQALKEPGFDLGETTIIMLGDRSRKG